MTAGANKRRAARPGPARAGGAAREFLAALANGAAHAWVLDPVDAEDERDFLVEREAALGRKIKIDLARTAYVVPCHVA